MRQTLDSIFNLGRLLQDKGEHEGEVEEAATLLREELECATKRDGKDQEEVLESANNLHELLVKAGKEEEAKELKTTYDLGSEVVGARKVPAKVPALPTAPSATKVDWGRDDFNS